ncbi:MAG TPA: molybdenum cofactor biosynthesis protein MoaE [Acidimicrobiales bacterium]|nr:molybdenum cofactor biosynthesis protein MoaE [Acidimicrobiales bacterium]
MESTSTTDWIHISTSEISAEELTTWATRAESGAVVTFCGTVRDRDDDRDDVIALEYETDPTLAEARIRAIVATARARWPELAAVAVHHRVGRVDLLHAAVVVAVSSPHRREAFEAAEFCIDTLKESVPIYKRDVWSTGSDWSSDTRPVVDVPPA